MSYYFCFQFWTSKILKIVPNNNSPKALNFWRVMGAIINKKATCQWQAAFLKYYFAFA